MPLIQVKVAGSLTKEQKQAITKSFCKTLQEVADKNPESTYIIFEEVSRENWAVGNNLLSEKN